MVRPSLAKLTIHELMEDVSLAERLRPEEVPKILAQLGGRAMKLAALQTALAARLAVARPNKIDGGDMDKLLTVREAAEILGVSEDHLYREASRYPFTVKLSERRLRFSLRGIRKFIDQQQR